VKIFIIGDMHAPWTDIDCLHKIYSLISSTGPYDLIVQIGDLYDCFAQSKFPKSPHLTAHDELEEARRLA